MGISQTITNITKAIADINSTRANINLSNLTSKGNERLLNGSEPHIFEAQKGFKTENVLDDPFGYQELYENKYSLFKKDDFSIIGTPVDGSEEILTDDGVVTIKSPNVGGAERFTIGQPDYSNAGSVRFESPVYYLDDNTIPYCLVEYIPNNPGGLNPTFSHSATVSSGVLKCSNRVVNTDGSVVNNVLTTSVSISSLRNNKFQLALNYSGNNIDWFLKREGGTWEILGSTEVGPVEAPYIGSTRSYFVLGGDAYGTAKCIGMQMDLKYTRLYIDGNLVISGSPHNIDIIKTDNYEIVGSPIVSEDGLVNNLRRTNSAIKIPVPLDFSKNTIIQGTFKTSDNIGGFVFGLGNTQYALGTNIQGEVGQQLVWYNSTGFVFIPDSSLQPNTVYNFELTPTTITVGEFSVNINLDGVSVDFLLIGNSIKESYTKGCDGSIDLNSIKIYVNGNLVYQPCLKIPYTLSKTGSKIVPAYARNRVGDLYEQTGEALYWTIDEENKNYTLPKGEVYGMIDNSRKSNLPVGMIFAHTCAASYIPENSLPCDGAEYTRDQFPNLFDEWLLGNKLNTCTYEAFQSDLNTYGKCGKFGIDTVNNKFKAPHIPDGTHIQQAMTDDELGKIYNAGLPNIEGSLNGIPAQTTATGTLYGSGLCSKTETNTVKDCNSGGSNQPTVSPKFDASDSNPIYGNSDTVQPEAVALRYFIVVATGSINQSAMDWSQWASSLQGKLNADHSNDTKPYITETYVNGTSWYRVWSDGWCEQGGEGGTMSASSSNATLRKTLLKPLNIDLPYYVNASAGFSNGNAWNGPACYLSASNEVTLSVWITGSGTVSFQTWIAKGFIIQEENNVI